MDRALGYAIAVSGLLTGGLIASRAARDGLFLSHYPASALPAVMIAAATLSILAAMGASRLIARSGPARTLPVALTVNGAIFVAEGALVQSWPRSAALALYLHVTALGPVLLSGYWAVINERFDPFTAKRVVSRVASAGALAGVVGGFAAERVASMAGVAWVLVLLAGLALAAAFAVRGIGTPEAAPHSPLASEAGALARIRRDPLLAQMAVLMVALAGIDALVDYAMKVEAAEVWRDTDALVRFFAIFYVGCGLLAFAFQLAVGSRLLQRFGLAGTMGVLPASVALMGLLAAFSGRLWTIIALRATENVVSAAMLRPGFELLYTPIPRAVKRPVKTWIDVAARSAGSIGGSALILGLLFLVPELPTVAVVWLAIGVSALAAVGVLRIHRAYVLQLGTSLRSGAVALSPDDVEDATTARTIADAAGGFDRRALLAQVEAHWRQREAQSGDASALVEVPLEAPPFAAPSSSPAAPDVLLERIADLASADPPRVRRALHAREAGGGMRAAAAERRLAAHVIPLLDHAQLGSDAAAFLRRVAGRCVGQLVDGLLDRDERPGLRLALARLLGSVDLRRALEGLWLALDDPDFELRRACGQAAVRLVERSKLSPPPRDAVHARLERELAGQGSGRPTSRELEHLLTLLALLHGRDTMASTLTSLESDNAALRGTALELLESVLPPGLRATLFARLGVAGKPDAV